MTVKELMEILKDADPGAKVSFVEGADRNREIDVDNVTTRGDMTEALGWKESRNDRGPGDVVLLAYSCGWTHHCVFPEHLKKRP